MPRAFLLVLDGLGVGGAPDAARFSDTGADTLGHLAEGCAQGKGEGHGRCGPLHVPHLTALGLGEAHRAASGAAPAHMTLTGMARGLHGAAAEISSGKDTPSGHWEMAGVPVRFDWGYFHERENTFPPALLEKFIARGKLPGVLGNKHASGTVIIDELGEEHCRTGKPIVYTSADSVFQIAAHEEHFGLERLYALCHIARELVDDYDIGRVIARPFIGAPGSYKRTGNRHDYAVLPPAPTLLDRLKESGHAVIAVGKIDDIFAHSGTTQIVKADGNAQLFEATLAAARSAPDGALVFTNFVDFDMLWGHRRDIPGYAAALEYFDRRLPELEAALRPGDLVVLTADHGNDPSWTGSDHTREQVPVVAFGPGIAGGDIGVRQGFVDIGQTIAVHLGIAPLSEGVSFK
ncbi:MAG TPA: phosphopentomutase [Magnetospirillaceae bacterium]|jgi:phosphopentomutase